MAQSKQALRTRIKSVNSTKKITGAMEMIANAKLVKQRNRMEANREYAQILQDTVNEIVYENPFAESKFLKKTEGTRKATLMFCSDLGLCGSYNANMMKYAKEHLDPKDPVILVGTSLYRQIREAGFNLINPEPISSDKMTFNDLKNPIMYLTSLFETGETDVVQILYTRFINTMVFRPKTDTLLPSIPSEPKDEDDGMRAETMFEPNAETILNELIPMMITNVAYADWMESTTSEQGSRRMAMKTATDNAEELSANLRLEYNKARQAAITQEITEIVGGSAAV